MVGRCCGARRMSYTLRNSVDVLAEFGFSSTEGDFRPRGPNLRGSIFSFDLFIKGRGPYSKVT